MSRKIDDQDAQGTSKSSVGPLRWMVITESFNFNSIELMWTLN